MSDPTLVELVRTSIDETKRLRTYVVQAHEVTRAQIQALDMRQQKLEQHVYGSKPPPPDGGGEGATLASKVRQADERSTGNAHELAALEGRMIAGFAKLQREQEAQTRELTAQSRDLGLGLRGVRWLLSPRGVRQVQRTLTAAAAVVAAVASLGWCAGQNGARAAGGTTDRAPVLVPSGRAEPVQPLAPSSGPTTE